MSKTIINIGTDRGNICGVEIDKAFKEITYQDISKVAKERFGDEKGFRIEGWCVSKKHSK